MRNFILIALITLTACKNQITPQQKAEKLVKKYLDSTLNNPKSYESVSFSKLYKLKDTIANMGAGLDTIKYNGTYEIEHTYRASNAFGGIITQTEWFQVDSGLTQAYCCFRKPFNYYK